MTMTHTHTKTYALMDAWANTLPWDCLVRETGCVSTMHDHSPMVDQPCAAEDCGMPLRNREVCYAVTQLGRDTDGRERWVCWRHVRPDYGPLRIPKPMVT